MSERTSSAYSLSEFLRHDSLITGEPRAFAHSLTISVSPGLTFALAESETGQARNFTPTRTFKKEMYLSVQEIGGLLLLIMDVRVIRTQMI